MAEGQLRASLRALARGSTPQQPLETLTTPQSIMPGRFYDYEIAIAPTAYTFARGHRLQLRITSDNLPNALPGTLSLNPSDPAASPFVPVPPATNTIRLGGRDGTSLLLPVFGSPAAHRLVVRVRIRALRGSPRWFRLDARRSFERGGQIVSYRWTLGRRVLSRQAVFTHIFRLRAGRAERVRLTVTDASGRTATRAVLVRATRRR